MSGIISRLPSGGADVSVVTVTSGAQIAKDKVIVGADGNPIIGLYNMDNLTAANVKSGVVFGVGATGSYTDDGNLEADKLLAGQTGYSVGTKIQGTMQNIAGQSQASGQWHDGTNLYFRIAKGAYITNASGDTLAQVHLPISSVLSELGAKRYASGTYIVDGTGVNGYSYTARDGASVTLYGMSPGFLSTIGFTASFWTSLISYSPGNYNYVQYTESSGMTRYFSYTGSVSYGRPYELNFNGNPEIFLPGNYANMTVTWKAWE